MAIEAGNTRLRAARDIFEHLARRLDMPFTLRLWDGSTVPLGEHADPRYIVSIAGPGTIGSLLRRPTLDNLARHYAAGNLDLEGADLLSLFELARRRRVRLRLGDLDKGLLLRRALPLLLAPADRAEISHRYSGEETGRNRARRDEAGFVQFHYDLGNEFYGLFLDPEMQYSCAYFTDWGNSLEQAQRDKLDMICRKLRLEPGDRLLDIGCGWGGLLCHAARVYGVRAHGVTLSKAQHAFALARIDRLGLAGQVTIALGDYRAVEGEFDKIASIGMYEHVGIANYPGYFRKLNSLLRDRGILLNHGITRRAKASKRRFRRVRPESRLIRRYVFPGSELDHIGHTLESMEAQGFEVHDVEGWREHYASTCRHWHRRLVANEEAATLLVGRERYRMWAAYLAAVSLAFQDGSLRIFQVVASKHKAKGASGFPPTRADLYR